MPRVTAFALCLLALCPSRSALAGWAASVSRPAPQQVKQSVDRAVGYLRAESGAWLSTRKCAACHHAAMPLWALGEAGRQGYAVDRKFVVETAANTLGSREKMIAAKLIAGPNDPPDPRPLARGVSTGSVFMAVAVRSLPDLDEGQKQTLAWIADQAVTKQQADGSWEFFLCRPPVNENQMSDSAWVVLALQGETGPGAPESRRAALRKASAWLAGVKPSDSLQDLVLPLLVAARAGKPRAELQRAVDAVLARQRPDGGWSQTPALPSDAFATGQALYALALAGTTADRPEIVRAVHFLVSTQKPDGSWPMASRSSPDGKPGSAKLLTPITCAAASWATLGLSRLTPQRP